MPTKLDEGHAGLVPNEVPPDTSQPAPAGIAHCTAVPVLYYTTSGGRAGAEVVIVTDSIGGQRVLSPRSDRPGDLNPKRSPVTPERLARLRCLTILALLIAPPMGLLVLLALLRCRTALQMGDSAEVASLWASRVERLFAFAMLFVAVELVLTLLLVEYFLQPNGGL